MPIDFPNNAELHRRRSDYAYPSVFLDFNLENLRQIAFQSTYALDTHINNLLSSEDCNSVVHGYLGVIFWGHYSGQNMIERPQRAFGKARMAYFGGERARNGRNERIRGIVDIGIDFAAATIRTAANFLHENRYDEAMRSLQELPGIGFAFASKICAFVSPQSCGVMDSVIADKHPELNFTLRSGYLADTQRNRVEYQNYCHILQEKAGELNTDPEHSMWRDRDQTLHHWRAVDVERALY